MTDENIQERREIQKQLSYLVGKTTRHPVQVSSFGSTSNGFGEKSSDFDVCATCYQKIKFNKVSQFKTLCTLFVYFFQVI